MAKGKKEVKEEKLEEGLIRVEKGDETLDIHPTCLADHNRLGWVQIEVEPEPDKE